MPECVPLRKEISRMKARLTPDPADHPPQCQGSDGGCVRPFLDNPVKKVIRHLRSLLNGPGDIGCRIFGLAVQIFDVSGGLVDNALGLQSRIPREFAGSFWYFAANISGSAGNAIFIHCILLWVNAGLLNR